MANLYFPASADSALRDNLLRHTSDDEVRQPLSCALGNDGDSVDFVMLESYQGEALCKLPTDEVVIYAPSDSSGNGYGLYHDGRLFAYLNPARPAAKIFVLDPCPNVKQTPLTYVKSSLVVG